MSFICGTCEGPITGKMDTFLRCEFQLFVGERIPITAPKGSWDKCSGGQGICFCSRTCKETFRAKANEAKRTYLANREK